MSAAGRLFLVPAWLSEDGPVEAALPATALETVRGLRDFIVEDAKSARRFLAACAHPVALRELHVTVLDEHTAPRDCSTQVQALSKLLDHVSEQIGRKETDRNPRIGQELSAGIGEPVRLLVKARSHHERRDQFRRATLKLSLDLRVFR